MSAHKDFIFTKNHKYSEFLYILIAIFGGFVATGKKIGKTFLINIFISIKFGVIIFISLFPQVKGYTFDLLSTEYNLKKTSKSPKNSHILATRKTNKNKKSDHKVTQTNKNLIICGYSSAGQSDRLLSDRSDVQIISVAPILNEKRRYLMRLLLFFRISIQRYTFVYF